MLLSLLLTKLLLATQMSDTCSNFISPKTLFGETVSNFLFGNPTERLWYLGADQKKAEQ